jgi:hypothetical protein
MIAPETRCWERVTEYKKTDGKFIFTYNPYHLSEIATMFIHATYKNGFETSSNIIAKRFADGEIKKTHQSKIIYSSRIENSDSVFTAVDQTKGNDTEFINVKGQNDVVVEKGPMAIEGVYSKYGLSTFKVLEKKYKPMDGAMLMFDAYAKTQGQLTVKLIRDYYGAKTTYVATVNLTGGDVWQNVQLDMNRFKTVEGMVLKSYENISAIEFNVEGVEFLINNALWV